MDKLRIPPLIGLSIASLISIFAEVAEAQTVAENSIAMHRVVLPSPEHPSLTTKQSAALFATRTPAEGGFEADDMTVLTDGTATWCEMFVSSSAYSMSLCLSDISIPSGGEITVCDTLGTDTKTVWMSDGASEAITPTIFSSAIVIRYVGPASPLPSFRITAANCGFRPIGQTETRGSNKAVGVYGASDECEIPAMCGPASKEHIRSVCRLILNGALLGTGTLVNNTAEDRSPLVLTSAHVVDGTTLVSCEALFNFEEPVCENGFSIYNNGTETISGATIEAFDIGVDMAVLKLSQSPSMNSAPYWMGWSRASTVNPDEMLTCVHHPIGDVKKVSTTLGAAGLASYSLATNALGEKMTAASHWLVDLWETGTTEGGSSGSALVTSDNLILGGLTGGRATCKTPKYDYYWMMYKAWNAKSHGYKTLGEVLDPLGLNPQSLNGLNYEQNGYEIGTDANFAPADGIFSEYEVTTDGTTGFIQPITSPATRTYWAIGINAASANTLSNNSTVRIGVTTSQTDTPTQWASVRLKLLMSSGSVVVALPSPVTVKSGDKIYVHITTANFGSSDEMSLLTAKASGDYAIVSENGSKTTIEGECIALNTIFTGNADTALTQISNHRLKIRMADGEATLYGAAMRLVAVYDLKGQNVWNMEAEGRTEVAVGMCGMPSGLYIVRVLLEDGTQKQFKVLNN